MGLRSAEVSSSACQSKEKRNFSEILSTFFFFFLTPRYELRTSSFILSLSTSSLVLGTSRSGRDDWTGRLLRDSWIDSRTFCM